MSGLLQVLKEVVADDTEAYSEGSIGYDALADLMEHYSDRAFKKGAYCGWIPAVSEGDKQVIQLHLEDEVPYGPTQIINRFYCRRKRVYVLIYIDDEGTRTYTTHSFHAQKIKLISNTIGYVWLAWSMRAEAAAMESLKGKVSVTEYTRYYMTGAILERGKSGVLYVLRRGRPTIVLGNNGKCNVVLCTHPVSFWVDCYGGYLCPTDDIIAQLMLIRADEHRYWKKATQHNPTDPEADLL